MFILKIAAVDSSRGVPIYFLNDLMSHRVRGSYYKQQLKKAPTPGKFFKFSCKTVVVVRDLLLPNPT